MDNQASGLSFGATGAADIFKIGTQDAGPQVAVAGRLSATTYGSDGTVSDAELLYLGDVTSAIQAQFSAKAPVAAPVFTTSAETPYLIIGTAATAADEGGIRLPNASYIFAEADAASTDISVIGVDSAEVVQIAASGATRANVTAPLTSRAQVTHTTTGSVALTCAANSSGIFTNSGADADVTYTLEECLVGVEGCKFTFIITDFAVAGDEFWVDAHANDQFYGMYSTNANGDKLEGDNTLGSILNVLCLKNTAGTYEWLTSGSGNWTDMD
jgi:hypothetical protein